MQGEFEMSMMGELTFFLGLQIKQKKNGIFISQAKYCRELLKKFGMDECKEYDTPMSTTAALEILWTVKHKKEITKIKNQTCVSFAFL